MDFSKFTTKCQLAINEANQLAVTNKNQLIENGHLLKGMLQVDNNVTPHLLNKFAVNLNVFKQALDGIIQSYPIVTGAQAQLSRNTQSSLNNAIELAKNNIRNGKGPQFIEFSTYRWREHCGVNYDNDIGYRTEKEYNEWKTKDPIKLLQNKIILQKNIQSDFFQSIENEIKNEINGAFEFAERSPFPESKEAYHGEYAES